MGDISNNLSRHEFECHCGCGLDTVDFMTAKIIQDVCDHYQCSVVITSGCRCVDHNLAEGGLPLSQHPKCRAADCGFRGPTAPSSEEVHAYLCAKYPNLYGFGLYSNRNHIDSRTDGPARWDAR